MTMDNGEIIRSYKSAKSKSKQICILAELNNCSVEKIKEILSTELKPQEMPRNREKKPLDKAETQKYVQELQKENKSLLEECKKLQMQLIDNEKSIQIILDEKNSKISKLEKTVDAYYKEKNEYLCKIKDLNDYCMKLEEEQKEPSETCDEQSHFIYENQLNTTIDVLVGKLALARKVG